MSLHAFHRKTVDKQTTFFLASPTTIDCCNSRTHWHRARGFFWTHHSPYCARVSIFQRPCSRPFRLWLGEFTRFLTKRVDRKWTPRDVSEADASVLIYGRGQIPTYTQVMDALRVSIIAASAPSPPKGKREAFDFLAKVASPYGVAKYNQAYAEKEEGFFGGKPQDNFKLTCIEVDSLQELSKYVTLQSPESFDIGRLFKDRIVNGRMLRKVFAVIHIQVEWAWRIFGRLLNGRPDWVVPWY